MPKLPRRLGGVGRNRYVDDYIEGSDKWLKKMTALLYLTPSKCYVLR